MDTQQFFNNYGHLEISFGQFVFGPPVTVEILYQQFAERLKAEAEAEKAKLSKNKTEK